MLFTVLTALVVGCGWFWGGQVGMFYALGFAAVMNSGAYWFGDRAVLRMHRAQRLSEEEAPEVFEIARRLSEKAGIPAPKIYLLPSASANAFAAGRGPKHATIAVTHGVVKLLNKEELEGLIGHELSHILNRNILISTVAATLAGALAMIANMFQWSLYWGESETRDRDRTHPIVFLLISIIMPLSAALIQLAISRSREYEADQGGAELCENPLYLASALKKIEAAAKQLPLRDAQPATAHLFVINPLPGTGWAALFSTHPPVEDRIVKLEKMALQNWIEEDGGRMPQKAVTSSAIRYPAFFRRD